MKKHIITAFLSIFAVTAYCQTDKPIAGIPPYRTPQQTIGETYVLLPLSIEIYKEYRMKNGSDVHLDGTKAGKTLKLISLDEHESTALLEDSVKVKYTGETSKSRLSEVVPLLDLEAAQRFSNKTVWLNVPEINEGKPSAIRTFGTLNGLRFEQVTIVGIGLSPRPNFPFIFTVKTNKGQLGFVYCYLSGTNTDRDEENSFQHNFLTEDPKLKYHFTPAVWKMVKAGYTEIGMPIDAFVLVKGYPTAIHNTQTAKGTTQQYVYGTTNPSYYYFAGGKLTAKQDQ